MLEGNINFTQVSADITFDDALLTYSGFEDLQGWVAVCTLAGANTVAVRSVPSMNMALGTPCSPAINIVTLKFIVEDAFTAYQVDTTLDFDSITVNAAAGYNGATTAPGQAVTITLRQPVDVEEIRFEEEEYYAMLPESNTAAFFVVAKAYDSLDNEIVGVPVTYGLAAPYTGVSIDSETGEVTLSYDALPGTATISASYDNCTKPLRGSSFEISQPNYFFW
jgi:hypothetical protein